MVIEGPVYSWKNGRIRAYNNSELTYDDNLLSKDNILIINGMELYKI